MNKTSHHIIKNLKRQPKQGMPGAVEDLGKGLGAAVDVGNAALNTISSTANQAVLGVGLLTKAAEDLAIKFRNVTEQTSQFENEAAGLANTFGINIIQAQKLNLNLANISKNFQGGAKYLGQYVSNLKALTGGFAANANFLSSKYGNSLLKTQELLITNLKLTGDQANKYAAYATGTKNSSVEQLVLQSEIADKIEATTGLTGVFRDSIEDISELSADVQMQYSKIPGSLELAVVKARQLGLKISDLHKTGKQLLNIESSIGDELEYQLLSGNRLVDQQGNSLTNKYRQAVMGGKINDQAEILNQIFTQEGKTLEGNMFAREQLGKLLGMDEATVARTIQKQKVLSELGAEAQKLMGMNEGDLGKAVMNTNAFKKMTEEQQDSYLGKIQKLNSVQTTDEKMVQGIDKMVSLLQTDIFTKLGAEGLDAAALFEARQKDVLAGSKDVNAGLLTAASTDVGKLATSIGAAVTSAGNIISQIPGLGKIGEKFTIKPQRANIYAQTVTLATSKANSFDDGVIAPGDGKVLFSGGKASLFSSDDYITASTNNPLAAGKGNGSTDLSAFTNAIVAAINNQTSALTSNSGINAPYWS